MATPAEASPKPRTRSIRITGGVLLLVWAALIALVPSWNARLATAGYDAWQALLPRQEQAFPVTVVDIDERSLAALGRWPWPRTLLARLIDAINAVGPAAIGVDMFMPEADPGPPARLRAPTDGAMPDDSGKPAVFPSNDAALAAALSRARAVVAIAGLPDTTGMTLRVTPMFVRDASAPAGSNPPALDVPQFAGALTSVDEINRAASGWGLVSTGSASDAVRRIPLAASIEGTLVPAFAVEVIRLAAGARALRVDASGSAVRGVSAGPVYIPTERDGAVRIHYSPRRAERLVSAIDVLEGRVDPARLKGRLVLVGVSGIGLSDFHQTPLGVSMPGTEIQAQLLENMREGALLARPAWAPALEAALFLVLGGILVLATSTLRPAAATVLAAGCVATPIVVAFVAFRWHRIVLDAASPSLGIVLLFGALLLLTLAEATRHRRALERAMQAERERSARMAGELDAARRIQMASLPDASQFRDDPRVDVAAAMDPAREVGGDLYDFFRLDEHRLFCMVGDVAGKGLSASIFMAVSRALCKSTALRMASADLGQVVTEANAEVARDNPQLLFVTAFVAILDLDTGELVYCNAGHENPFVVDARGGQVRRLEGGGGPPLCAVDAFGYQEARDRLREGEFLCAVSDGITEAHDRAGALYGSDRTSTALRAAAQDGAAVASTLVQVLRREVERFSAGTEPADDMTVLVVRWNGAGRRTEGRATGAA